MKTIASVITLVAAAYAMEPDEDLARYPKDVSWCVLSSRNSDPSEDTATVGFAMHELLSLGGGQLSNHMSGWVNPETVNSKFFDIPESQILNFAYIPPWDIHAGSCFRFWCANDPSVKMCDIYINIYKCNGCEFGLNSDFRNYLTVNNWVPSQCGPRFISDTGRDSHKMMSFRKQIPSNYLEKVDIDSDVKLIFASMSSKGIDCSQIPIHKCETSGYDQCRVIRGECVDNWCPRMFQGPCLPPCGKGNCGNCALNEPAFQ